MKKYLIIAAGALPAALSFSAFADVSTHLLALASAKKDTAALAA